jgi:hypothetical protein
MHYFTKTGSGQHRENSKKRTRFLSVRSAAAALVLSLVEWVLLVEHVCDLVDFLVHLHADNDLGASDKIYIHISFSLSRSKRLSC